MSRHLAACPSRPTGTAPTLHVAVEGRWHPDHWMQLELQPRATFAALDEFLRDAWLECCGHMSDFRIGETRIGANGARPVAQVLRPGDKFRYDYDFGSTTTLLLRVVAARLGAPSRHPVRLLALNDQPRFPCSHCGAEATWVDTLSGVDVCDACLTEHDEEMCLPLVNSPRAGVCAYFGPAVALPPLTPA